MSRRREVMLAQKLTPRLLEQITPPYYVQEKFNGDRCRAIITRDGVKLYTSELNERISVPHINDALRKLKWPSFAMIQDELELDGELYVHGMTHQQIRSIVGRSVNMHLDYWKINYYIFDVPNARYLTGELMRMKDRLNVLQEIGTQLNCVLPQHTCRIVGVITAHDLNQVMELTASFMRQGYEGAIIRDPNGYYERCGPSGTKRSRYLLKVKPRRRCIALIEGTQEEVSIQGKLKNSLGAFQCSTEEGVPFNVGSGKLLTKQMRSDLWKQRDELVGRRLIVKYQELTEDRVPYAPTVEELI